MELNSKIVKNFLGKEKKTHQNEFYPFFIFNSSSFI